MGNKNKKTKPKNSANYPSNLKMALLRIQNELNVLKQDPLSNCSAGPDNNDLFNWQGMVLGPENSPYNDGIFYLTIKFPENYPYKPPRVIFTTKIYHCNIDSKGMVYLDILEDKWSPSLTIT